MKTVFLLPLLLVGCATLRTLPDSEFPPGNVLVRLPVLFAERSDSLAHYGLVRVASNREKSSIVPVFVEWHVPFGTCYEIKMPARRKESICLVSFQRGDRKFYGYFRGDNRLLTKNGRWYLLDLRRVRIVEEK